MALRGAAFDKVRERAIRDAKKAVRFIEQNNYMSAQWYLQDALARVQKLDKEA